MRRGCRRRGRTFTKWLFCYQSFPYFFATGTRRCVCQKFHHPTVCKVLSR